VLFWKELNILKCAMQVMAKSGKRKVHEYDVVIEQDEDGVYIAYVPELPGCQRREVQWMMF